MRILVTGGAGFIGSHVVDGLVALGHRVRVVDRLHPRAHAGRPDYLREEVEYLEADLGGAAVDAALDGVEAVCHQAATARSGRRRASPPTCAPAASSQAAHGAAARWTRWRSPRRRRRTPAACTRRPSSTRSTSAWPANARAGRR